MPKKSEYLNYFFDNLSLKGYAVYPDTMTEKTSAILVAPTFMGLNPFIQQQCERIADLGYVSFALDYFGEGGVAKDHQEARSWITPLLEDRKILIDRLYAALNFLRTHSLVNSEKIAALGYCFGGRAILELAKSGANLLGAVSVHGVLGNPLDLEMKPVETAPQIPASILLLHGYKDAMAPEEDLIELEKEMSLKGVDWQVVIYGEAMHAFTNPSADMPELSLQYHEKSAKRAFKTMTSFFEEVFS